MLRSAVSRRFRLSTVLVGLLILAAPALPLQAAGDPQLASAEARDLWLRGSDQVLAGNFDTALSSLERAQKLESDTRLTAAISWLRDAKTLADSRDRLRVANYEKQVAEAQAQAEKKAWSDALRFATMAIQNYPDREAFGNQPWVQEIIPHILKKIEKHKTKNEWSDAFALYLGLKELDPKNKEYKEGLRVCRQRAHFEVVYGPKGTWKSDLRGVTASVVPELISRVDDEYVTKVDFKKLGVSAIENLLILAGTPKLKDVFQNLADKEVSDQFIARMKGVKDRHIQTADGFSAHDLKKVFDRVCAINDETIRLPESVLVDEFVAGMLEPLDEFTAVIWPSEVDEFNKHTRGEFIGVGIQITKPEEGGFLRVESPLEDSPAYRAGIQPGDWISEVDGKSTKDITITQAVTMITGRPHSKVALTIKDPNSDATRTLSLEREQIKIQTVRGDHRDPSKPTKWDYMLDADNKIAYVRVSGFMENTVEDLDAALKQMRREGCRGLILDLRFNPGGLLTSAKEMCELFLEQDAPITKTMGRGRRQDIELRANPVRENFHDIPTIVLVNEYSASDSEIVAGALAGLKEACIIGERTFGKGSVQNLIPVASHQAYLKLTTAHYYVPDADSKDHWYCLNKEEDATTWGVDPHITVKVIPQEIGKILRLRRQRDLLKGRNQEKLPEDVLERRPTTQPALEEAKDENPDVDPQIATALNVMRVKLVSKQPWALAPRQQRALSQANPPKVTTE